MINDFIFIYSINLITSIGKVKLIKGGKLQDEGARRRLLSKKFIKIFCGEFFMKRKFHFGYCQFTNLTLFNARRLWIARKRLECHGSPSIMKMCKS